MTKESVIIFGFFSGVISIIIAEINYSFWPIIIWGIIILWSYRVAVKNEKQEIEQYKLMQAKKIEEEERNKNHKIYLTNKRAIEREIKNYLDNKNNENWKNYYKRSDANKIDKMTGLQFEELVAQILTRLFYQKVSITPRSYDQGVDIIAYNSDGIKIAIQAKRWNNRVGNRAIQELLGGIEYYNCKKGLIITNSYFTESAIALAKKIKRIDLIDRDKFLKLYDTAFPIQPPPFNRELADKLGLFDNKIPKSKIRKIFFNYGVDYEMHERYKTD